MKCRNGEIFYSLKEAQIVIEKGRVECNSVSAILWVVDASVQSSDETRDRNLEHTTNAQ